MGSWFSRTAYTPVNSAPHGRFRGRRWKASPTMMVVLVAIFSVFGIFSLLARHKRGSELPPGLPSDLPPSPPPLPSSSERTGVDALFERQSESLEQAVARYTLRNDRSPPRNYDQWFRFAKKNGCLIDDYDQIHRDFEPLRQLAEQDRKFFSNMVERASKMAIADDMGMKTIKVKNGVAAMTDDWQTNYNDGWMTMLENIGAFLPNINVIINHRDEPRVAFDVRDLQAQDAALKVSDPAPFRNAPHPTSEFYTDEGHCLVPNNPGGFLKYANDASSFLMYSASADFTTDLYPILSQSKIYPCFADILFPSEWHYPRSRWSPKYAFPDNVAWEDKSSLLYWRGQSTGGWISGSNYHGFPRFKLLDIARNHTALMDVAITAFYEHFCQLDGCDAAAIKAEYNFTGESAPREDGYRYKYVLDIDGNSFSGRYLGLLKSGSLVFKSTLFTEYFDGWLRPFVHYIPVLPDLSDLVARIEWARAHDAEARRIQAAGQELVERVITDAQNDCYFLLVLLEWARLQNGDP